MERERRKKNIEVYGQKRTDIDFSVVSICKVINQRLDTEISASDISASKFLGQSERSPPKIEFIYPITKSLLLRETKRRNLSIPPDHTKHQQQERETLRQYLSKRKGKISEIIPILEETNYSLIKKLSRSKN